MGKMTITAYTDEHFEREYKSALELPVNPDKMKLTKGIRYAEDKQLGSLNGSNVYINYRPETLYFECLFDMTNAMEDDDEKKPVREVVNNLKNACTTTTAKDTVLHLSGYSMAISFSSGNSKHSIRNIRCSTWTVFPYVPN